MTYDLPSGTYRVHTLLEWYDRYPNCSILDIRFDISRGLILIDDRNTEGIAVDPLDFLAFLEHLPSDEREYLLTLSDLGFLTRLRNCRQIRSIIH